ncbi:MAG: hypothetical protein J6W73_03620, partial [Verrucomicrobia bacterium]|nr:hypothetical protein [Verrucomicrobiota bacterium]
MLIILKDIGYFFERRRHTTLDRFADEMTETPAGTITADTNYKELDEWGSLASLSIISMIDEEYGKLI